MKEENQIDLEIVFKEGIEPSTDMVIWKLLVNALINQPRFKKILLMAADEARYQSMLWGSYCMEEIVQEIIEKESNVNSD